MPGRPEEPGPHPQSCDVDYSQRREWDHQGCLGHFQEGQGGHFFRYWGAQEGVSTISVLWTFLLWNLLMASVL